MHVSSRRLLDCAWKAAAGGTSVRYYRDRANPTTTAAQNGLLGQHVPMRRVHPARVLGWGVGSSAGDRGSTVEFSVRLRDWLFKASK